MLKEVPLGHFENCVFGGTGFTGALLLQYLTGKDKDENGTAVFLRKSIEQEIDSFQQFVLRGEVLDSIFEGFKINTVFICLGTTIKKAGSQEAFKAVDLDLVVKCAHFAKKHGAKRLFVISAIGADSQSSVFYSKIKGLAEQGLRKLHFEELHIFRPSLILGDRQEFRLGERISVLFFRYFGFLFSLLMGKYRPIDGAKLAQAMYLAAEKQQGSGEKLYFYSDMINLIKESK
jgi:uncharacterized protein YbjT (DUF2867 family)